MLFADRLEIWNAGSLPSGWTVDMLLKPHTSLPPNELIAGPMYLKGYIERLGTGTEDVAKLCARSGLPAPGFAEGVDFRAVLKRKRLGGVAGGVAGGVVGGVRTRLLLFLSSGEKSTGEMARHLGWPRVYGGLNREIKSLLADCCVEYTIPEKPQSRLQKYRLTAKGRELLARHSEEANPDNQPTQQ